MARFPKLAGVAEVAALAGVSKQRAGQLTKLPGFPKPVDSLAMGPVWREADVQKFLDAPRPAGRPRKADGPFRSSGPSLVELDAYGDFAPERRETEGT